MHGIICYWRYVKTKNNYDKQWVLAESFAIDLDGRPLTIPSTGGGDRVEWDKWMNKKVYANKEAKAEDDYDWEPIMGRAVTICTLESGVRLLDIHPPEWSDWLSISFYEELCKSDKWVKMLERGFDMYLGTAKEARKYWISK